MTRRFSLLYLLLVLPLGACKDQFGPRDWTAFPDTAVLYSLSRPEYIGRTSGFDFGVSGGIPRVVESVFTSGQWDVAILDDQGTLKIAPASSFEGVSSRAAIATITGTTLEDLERAPRDDEFVTTLIVPDTSVVYVARSRTVGCDGFGGGGRYAKFEILEVNDAEGWIRLRYIQNPYCNDRKLIPPDSD